MTFLVDAQLPPALVHCYESAGTPLSMLRILALPMPKTSTSGTTRYKPAPQS